MYRLYLFSNNNIRERIELTSFRRAARLAAKYNGYWVIIERKSGDIVSPNVLSGTSPVGPKDSRICQRFRNETKDRKVKYTL